MWVDSDLGKNSVYYFKYFFCSFSSFCHSHYAYVTPFEVILQSLDVLFFFISVLYALLFYFEDFIDISSSSDSFCVQCTYEPIKGILYFCHIPFLSLIFLRDILVLFYNFHLHAYITHLFLCIVYLLETLVPFFKVVIKIILITLNYYFAYS